MRLLLQWLALGLLGFALAAAASAAPPAGAYDAPLPAQLASDPDLCAYAPCTDVLPGADTFSPRKGHPAYVEAYSGGAGAEPKRLGYVFLSTDIVDIPGYSGKPMVTLIGMNVQGKITGVRILRHEEPILLVGIPEAKLTNFIRQFIGKFAWNKVEIGAPSDEKTFGIDAISGATVTVLAENQVVMRSAYEIARQVGIVKSTPKPQARLVDVPGTLDWRGLLVAGAVHRLLVKPGELGLPAASAPYIELYFGYLNAPQIGRSVLGEAGYQRLMQQLKPDEHAIFIVGNGSASFKGSGFVRGGIYDRVRVAQDLDTHTFRDTDYLNLYGVSAAGAPAYRESGIFIVRGAGFSAAYPWHLVFLGNRTDRQTGAKTFVSFEREYWLPAAHLEGGRPAVERPQPTWVRVWKAKRVQIAGLVALLLATAVAYGLRDRLARRSTRRDMRWISVPRYIPWSASVGFLGFYALAQPSVTQILTWIHSLVYEWRWELFLSDPLIFIFWWFIIISVFIWGRGLFCGWLCPYGSMSDLLFNVAGKLGLKRFQFQLPTRWHNRLKWVKYGVFTGLVALSLHSMGLAERLAEIEPFKSTFLVGGFWTRQWPFVIYWLVLFGASMFMERPFCKYLCPLGAGLAIPSTFRIFGLSRKAECSSCHACAKGCGSQAIDEKGRIDPRECMQCLECQVLYYDDHTCPPLAKERKARTVAGVPLTPIGRDGYFIPIKVVK
jgi:NosR/NirI family nitrous oxide reductase transcriptional regulator